MTILLASSPNQSENTKWHFWIKVWLQSTNFLFFAVRCLFGQSLPLRLQSHHAPIIFSKIHARQIHCLFHLTWPACFYIFLNPWSHFSKNLVHFANPYTARSRATEFSQTSRLQNLNLHAKSSRLEASQQNLTTGAGDISIFVKIFFENPQATFGTICPACCSREVLLFDRESNLRLY